MNEHRDFLDANDRLEQIAEEVTAADQLGSLVYALYEREKNERSNSKTLSEFLLSVSEWLTESSAAGQIPSQPTWALAARALMKGLDR